MLIDVHIHSKYSKRPSQWLLKKIGCPECFTEPIDIYQIAESRGMPHVTIADHNTINGALDIAHLPDTFISAEITTYFPADGCKIHVLALNITEAQHEDIQKARSSIFDLARYMYEQRIVAVVAHPLYAINDRLTLDHFEEMLLLFQNFELNGARNNRENQCLRSVLESLTSERIDDIAERHGREPLYLRPHEKRQWGGSDDHSSLNIARTHTVVRDLASPDVLNRDHRLTTKAVGQPTTALTMGHNLYGIAYQFYRSKFHMERYTDKDMLMRYTMVTCHKDFHDRREPGVMNFKPIGAYELPEYPEQKIFYPPLLEMLQYCHEQNFSHIHSATPGPIGLAALAIAKILKLPISGTYHTAIPQYAQILTGDAVIEELSWKYVLWYYDQMDVIYAPSQSTCEELIARGIKAEKIKVYPRGIDVTLFHPQKRSDILRQRFRRGTGLILIYVGRVSREKNLHLLADAFRRLATRRQDIHLTVVGDGPYLDEMRAAMADLPCYFSGYLTGEALARMCASADLFVFPSTTDTFGNVVLEAQASGLPVIVTDKGGPCENMISGKTGMVAPDDDTGGLLAALETMLNDIPRLREMARAARRYAQQRSFEAAFLKTWDMYNGKGSDAALSPPLSHAGQYSNRILTQSQHGPHNGVLTFAAEVEVTLLLAGAVLRR